jgi:regulator of protease activity HflC (stomatin/prohibitin superfamily)
MPVAQSVQNLEVRPRTYTMADTKGEGDRSTQRDAVEVQSINGTTFRVDVTIRYRIDAEGGPEFVEEWNTVDQAEQRLIRPTVMSQVRDTGSSIQSSVIFTQEGRRELENAAREALKERFSDEPLVLEAVLIRNVHIPDSYQKSLNQKEIAKQKVEREEFRVQQERKKAQQQIIAAQADAQKRLIRANASARSNYIVGHSLTRDVLVYEYIQNLVLLIAVLIVGLVTCGYYQYLIRKEEHQQERRMQREERDYEFLMRELETDSQPGDGLQDQAENGTGERDQTEK